MSTFERKFSNQGYGRYGRGGYLDQLPRSQWQHFNDFSGGYDARDGREDVPPNSTPFAIDTEVNNRDEITRAPGVTLDETFPGRQPRQLVLHVNLDYSAELVLFDPPFIGVKREANVVWTDVGLPVRSRRFASVVFGGVLVFTNGAVGVYARKPWEAGVELLEEAPVAGTYASFVGRLFAGGAIIGGNTEPLGVAWSGASADHRDWRGLGSGYELLIDDMSEGDRIVAMRTMGFDMLAVFCRNSVWLGRPTGQRNRPVAFQPRIPKVGAVNERAAQTTKHGVVFLHDTGVYLFNGNGAELISEQINPDLLPLDLTLLQEYSSFYDPRTSRYYLLTPGETWVCEMDRGRWFRRSLRARAMSLFAEQILPVTWGEMTGTWGEGEGTWEDYRPRQTEWARLMVLGEQQLELTSEVALGYEDREQMCNFGEPLTSFWEFPKIQEADLERLYLLQELQIKYRGFGTVGVRLPNGDGDYVGSAAYMLPTTVLPRTVALGPRLTGLAGGARLDFGPGFQSIQRVSLRLMPQGPRIARHALSRQEIPGYEGAL